MERKALSSPRTTLEPRIDAPPLDADLANLPLSRSSILARSFSPFFRIERHEWPEVAPFSLYISLLVSQLSELHHHWIIHETNLLQEMSTSASSTDSRVRVVHWLRTAIGTTEAASLSTVRWIIDTTDSVAQRFNIRTTITRSIIETINETGRPVIVNATTALANATQLGAIGNGTDVMAPMRSKLSRA